MSEPDSIVIKHLPQWVSYGPPGTQGGASDWCRLVSDDPDCLAPGGVTLCKRGTIEIHCNAKQYARQAWAVYGRYLATVLPKVAEGWVPEPVVRDWGVFQWKQVKKTAYRQESKFAPGGWLLFEGKNNVTDYASYSAEYYADLEWARLARENTRTSYVDNLRARTVYGHQTPAWLPPNPILTDADVRGANKYTRRAIVTAKDKAAGKALVRQRAA